MHLSVLNKNANRNETKTDKCRISRYIVIQRIYSNQIWLIKYRVHSWKQFLGRYVRVMIYATDTFFFIITKEVIGANIFFRWLLKCANCP